MRLATKLLGIALWLVIPPALAQRILGDLLDSGAKKLAGDEVKQELVQRVIVGPTATGGNSTSTNAVLSADGGAEVARAAR